MKLKVYILVTCLLLFALPAVNGCSNYTIPESIPNQPVEIVSFAGSTNSGTTIEIMVKNVSNGPIFHLVVGLDLEPKTPPEPLLFDFGFTQENTLAPGATTSLTRTVNYGTFNPGSFYVLGIDTGVLGQGGATTFNYGIKVKSSNSN